MRIWEIHHDQLQFKKKKEEIFVDKALS
jgi:hypothetical protein